MMRDIDLFQQALGLEPPWQVERSEFNVAKRRLDIFIDFPKRAHFTCPACGEKGLSHSQSPESSLQEMWSDPVG